VAATSEALTLIMTQIAEINAVVADIAASSREQATALNEVNTAINQTDQTTQQNAAMVEESTAAAHALSQETEELRRLIGMFRVGTDEAAETARDGDEGGLGTRGGVRGPGTKTYCEKAVGCFVFSV
jgi:methyl-accepting chemotaxis protein